MSDPQVLSDVYANVIDFRATPTVVSRSWAVLNTVFIQKAIDSGMHVLFPEGRYTFQGIVEFRNYQQCCTFLSGAVLEPFDSDSYVLITGSGQTITGLSIEAPKHVPAHSPLVDIYRAGGLQLEDLQVSVTSMAPPVSGSGPSAAVRVMCLTICKFLGGRITGSQESGSIGLWLASSYDYDYADPGNVHPRSTPAGEWSYPVTSDELLAAQTTSGAYEVGFVGLAINGFGWAVRVGCTCDNPNFVDCSFSDNVNGAVVVRDDADVVPAGKSTATSAFGLDLISCHMTGKSPQFVLVQQSCLWNSGAVLGCTFDVPRLRQASRLSSGSLVAGAQALPQSATIGAAGTGGTGRALGGLADGLGAAGLRSCIFRIGGNLQGVVVSGCSSEPSADRQTVWILSNAAGVTKTCDMFNAWAEPIVATGGHERLLLRMTGNSSGALTLRTDHLRFDAQQLGFFDALPDDRGLPYTVDAASATTMALNAGNTTLVLTQLLNNLAELGLVKLS